MWWNSAVENQAVDRIYRFGQKRSVDVIKFVVVNSIEERILEMQEKKQNLADGVLGDKGQLDFGTLTYSQFVSLFTRSENLPDNLDNHNVDVNLI